MGVQSKTFRLFVTLIYLATYISIAACGGRIQDGGYLKTCANPDTPKHAVISKLSIPTQFYDVPGGDNYPSQEYQEHDKVYFQCKAGFTPLSNLIMYVTCNSDGSWFPEIQKVGTCIPNNQLNKCGKGLFSCKRSGKCIHASRRCDCIDDCLDRSDEVDCEVRRRVITARTSGRRSAGVITSPGYPLRYPGNFTCVYDFYTDEDHRLELKFEEFNIRGMEEGQCVDYVRVTGIHPFYLRNKENALVGRNFIDLSESRCGNDKFDRLISNRTRVSIQIRMNSNYKRPLRGFSLWWRVWTAQEVANFPKPAIKTKSLVERDKSKSSSRDGIYTVLTPIAISAVLPLSLIAFLCFHRKIRQYADRKKQLSLGTDTISSDDSTDSSTKPIQPHSLTESSLSQFAQQSLERQKIANRDYYQRRLLQGIHPKDEHLQDNLLVKDAIINEEIPTRENMYLENSPIRNEYPHSNTVDCIDIHYVEQGAYLREGSITNSDFYLRYPQRTEFDYEVAGAPYEPSLDMHMCDPAPSECSSYSNQDKRYLHLAQGEPYTVPCFHRLLPVGISSVSSETPDAGISTMSSKALDDMHYPTLCPVEARCHIESNCPHAMPEDYASLECVAQELPCSPTESTTNNSCTCQRHQVHTSTNTKPYAKRHRSKSVGNPSSRLLTCKWTLDPRYDDPLRSGRAIDLGCL